VETGVDAELESELDAIGATSIGGRSGVVAFEEVSAPAETEVVVAVAAVAVDDEVVDDADVIDAVSIVVDVAALDVGASPICHTNVSPTFVICPDVARMEAKILRNRFRYRKRTPLNLQQRKECSGLPRSPDPLRHSRRSANCPNMSLVKNHGHPRVWKTAALPKIR